MYRLILEELINWKDNPLRMPLILRGARQVGKSYVIEKFGENNFEHTLVVNFEFAPELKSCFSDLDPTSIIHKLEYTLGTPIIPGKTLLFIDEIQEHPDAILALRYFKEKMPELHVIAAGSLLDFVINDEQFRMPVGRVQFIYLPPMSFKEFLIAMDQSQLKEYVENVTLETDIPSAIHQRLLELIRYYFAIGGMPGAIQAYQAEQSLLSSQRMQAAILTAYRGDFGKYSNRTQHKYLEKLFTRAPELIAQQFHYVDVSSDMQARDIKKALHLLAKANVLHQIFSTSATGLPLSALVHEKRFKLLFIDIGLAVGATQIDGKLLLMEDLMLINRGALAEQFVGQELLANQDYYQEPSLHYWSRDQRGSTAEVDYVLNVGRHIIPIKVKSGSTGRMRSLKQFMEKKNSLIGLRVSQLPLSLDKNILSIPFYLTSELRRLTQEYISANQ